jgi:hypothetical protein
MFSITTYMIAQRCSSNVSLHDLNHCRKIAVFKYHQDPKATKAAIVVTAGQNIFKVTNLASLMRAPSKSLSEISFPLLA